MPNYQKHIVYLSDEQREELFTNGTITVNGQTITYSDNDMYVTPQETPYVKPATGIPASDLAEGVIPEAPVQDVQVNGTSILQNGIANVPVANGDNFGLVKVASSGMGGLSINADGVLSATIASDGEIKIGTHNGRVLSPGRQHRSTFYGLAKAAGDTTQSQSSNAVGTYTPEAQSAIQTMLDVPSNADLTQAITDVTQKIQNMYICSALEYNGETGVPTVVNPDSKTFYLVPSSEGSPNLYIEWVYLNSTWERFGSATIDLSNYVQKTDYASVSEAGVVKAGSGVVIASNGKISFAPGNDAQIKQGTLVNTGTSISKQHIATFYGLAKAAGDTTQSQSSNAVGTYTSEAKGAIRSMIGAADADELNGKANRDGYYSEMTVGNAEQLVSSKFVEDSEPYILRPAGGSADIGNRENLTAIVGGTLAWNQQVRDEASDNTTEFADIVTVTDAVEDAAGVKVKIEPVQDLHGYDHPWPAGDGKNLFNKELAVDGSGYSFNSDGVGTISNAYSLGGRVIQYNGGLSITPGTTVTISADVLITKDGTNENSNVAIGLKANSVAGGYTKNDVSVGSFGQWVRISSTVNAPGDANWVAIQPRVADHTVSFKNVQVEIGSTATSYAPYSNICPITGHTAVTVTRTGRNLWNPEDYAPLTLIDDPTNVYYGFYAGSVQNWALTYPDHHKAEYGRISITATIGCYVGAPSGQFTFRIYFYYDDGTLDYPGGNIFVSAGQVMTITRTSTASKNCIGYGISTSAGTGNLNGRIKDVMVTLYGDDTTYVEPNVQTITLQLGQTVYGGSLTVNEDGTGQVVVDRAIITKLWSEFTNKAIGDVYAEGRAVLPSIDSARRTEAICDCLKYSTAGEDYGYCFYAPSGSNYVRAIVTANVKDTDAFTFVYPIATPQTYTLTASQVQTILGTNNVWADTGDVALTYTGTDEHLTLESGKKYLARISGIDSMLLGSGQEITAVKGTDNVFDLTKMFGTAVADYVYGQGASFFRKWFPNSLYAYNPGELKSVEGLQSHDTVGFNLWDEEWELGAISGGTPSPNNNCIRSKNFCECLGNQAYYCKCGSYANSYYAVIWWYDENKNYLSRDWIAGTTATSPVMAKYFKISTNTSTYVYGNTYKNDICINLAHNNSRNGEYESYEKHSYPLDSTVILRGIPKVGANGVYWDGDRYLPDGTVERKRRQIVFDGSESWARSTQSNPNGTFFTLTSPVPFIAWGSGGRDSAISNMFEKASVVGNEGVENKNTFWWNNGRTGFRVVFGNPNAGTSVDEFKSYLQEHPLVIEGELAKPTTETAQPYHSTQWVSDWGTEEFVSESLVPVGHETQYPANLRDKLQHLPDLASSNGIYLVRQTDSEMELLKLPDMPTANGNYRLKLNVASGSPTFSWEVVS